MKLLRTYPYRAGMLIWLLFLVIFSLVFFFNLHVFWLIDLLISLNCASFAIYGIDKLFAVGKNFRIPERVLWFSAFTGGPAGALFGMYVFHHKVSKKSFQLSLALVILVEVVIVLFVLTKLHILAPYPLVL
jgi:uncharacterized membrane protein YsdA (DUF1294 family)